MLSTFKLLLPALVPSWRFFDFIAPSPRIEFALFNDQDAQIGEWQAYRPRPPHVPFSQMLRRMFWNPWWNETLYITSCADRLVGAPEDTHLQREILQRIVHDIHTGEISSTNATHVQFRLLLKERVDTELVTQLIFISPSKLIHEPLNESPSETPDRDL